jgi:predicted nucleic acid-binding protein
LDASALVKLVTQEPEAGALRRMLRDWPRRVTSAIATVEVTRVARRYSTEAIALRRAEQALAQVTLVAVTDEILLQATEVGPITLRSLDAIHLASALSLERDLGGFVTYDADLADAARSLGIDVLAPS